MLLSSLESGFGEDSGEGGGGGEVTGCSDGLVAPGVTVSKAEPGPRGETSECDVGVTGSE